MSQGGEVEVRPTLSCMRDLGLEMPPMRESLSQIDDPVIRSAQQIPERVEAGSAERVRELTDRVWFKDRAGNWRSATVALEEAKDEGHPSSWWIGAAGLRRKGRQTSEPYSSWVAEAKRLGSAGGLSTEHLLPGRRDWQRWKGEQTTAEHFQLATLVPQLIAMSLRGAKGWRATRAGVTVQLLARASEFGEVYLAVFATYVEGTPKDDFYGRLAMVLQSVPGISQDDWQYEPTSGSPFRIPPGVVVYSAILPPEVQVQLLDRYPDDVAVDGEL